MLTKNRAAQRAIASIGDDAWTPVKYPGAVQDPGEWISDAEVAEIPYTAFASKPDRVTARLIVPQCPATDSAARRCAGCAGPISTCHVARSVSNRAMWRWRGQEHAVDEPAVAPASAADVATALRELKTRQKRERLALGQSWDETTNVCSDETGKAVLPRTYAGWFHRIRIAAELPRITLRNLRHTSVSVMLHASIPASTVAAWHGHDVRMTTTVYNRPKPWQRLNAACAPRLIFDPGFAR